jgi:hypothetical protein
MLSIAFSESYNVDEIYSCLGVNLKLQKLISIPNFSERTYFHASSNVRCSLSSVEIAPVPSQSPNPFHSFSYGLVGSSLASTFDKMTQVGDFTSIGIPLTASIAAGFTVALAKS